MTDEIISVKVRSHIKNVNLFEQNRTIHMVVQLPHVTEFYSQLNLTYDGSMQ